MHILFYEPTHTGHHYAYLARMLPGFLSLPVRVTIAISQEGLDSKEFEKTLAPLKELVTVHVGCTPASGGVFKKSLHKVRELADLVKNLSPDHVYVMYGDGIWQILTGLSLIGVRPLPKTPPFEAWVYRGDFASPRRDSWKSKARRILFRVFLRSGIFTKINIDHELLYEMTCEIKSKKRTECSLTPNPVWVGDRMSMTEARKAMGLPEGGRLVVSSGMIDSRKGMDLLIAAFEAHLRLHLQSEDRLLLAGPHAAEIVEMISNQPYRELVESHRILSINRFIDEKEMYLCAAAGNLTVAPYPDHSGRSSIILWAAVAGRPSLGTDWGCIGHVIRNQNLGMTCDVLNLDEFVESIGRALAMEWSEADQVRVRNYGATHSMENYQKAATELLRFRIAEEVAPS
jgi:glycosyltransferase involved in cell wall biosynthesis